MAEAWGSQTHEPVMATQEFTQTQVIQTSQNHQGLTKDEYKFGRNHDNDHRLSDITISGRHFIIKRVQDKNEQYTTALLEDRSTNGTKVNGQLVGKNNSRALKTGDVIHLPLKGDNEPAEAQPAMREAYVFTLRYDAHEAHRVATGHFEITNQELGKGNFASVYLAANTLTRDVVAAKCIDKKKTISMMNHTREKILEEITILKGLSHPCVIKIYEFYETETFIYILLELVSQSLFDYIINSQRLSEPVSKHLFYQMLLGVKYLHDRGITHRDIKPDNVLLEEVVIDSSGTKDLIIKITDFGLAKIVGENTFMKTMCGTPNYLAPEILEKSDYTSAVDCWSLGVVLFIMLSGYMPFSDEIEMAPPLTQQILNGCPGFPNDYWSDVSAEAKDMIHGLMTVDPKERLTIDQALAHPWLQDEQMRMRVDRLLHKAHDDSTASGSQ